MKKPEATLLLRVKGWIARSRSVALVKGNDDMLLPKTELIRLVRVRLANVIETTFLKHTRRNIGTSGKNSQEHL